MIRKIKDKIQNANYYVLYTALFILVSFFIFSWFIFAGKNWVELHGDGYRQRLRAMYFYSDYLKTIVKTLFYEHRLVIPNWDFAIGEGGDVLGTLQYFAEMGDPLSTFCLFVPARFLPLFYSLVVVLRLYFAGVSFSLLARFKGYTNKIACLSGAIAYIYCGWSFVNIARYPHYLIPMVWFPLIILGVEMVLEDKRPYVLSFAVMFAALSNFYYFYVTVILTVVYVLIRFIFKYGKDIKTMALKVLSVGIFSGAGALLASITVLPSLYAFTNDARTSIDYASHFLYSVRYYSGLFGKLVGTTDCSIDLGSTVVGLIAVFLLFIKKDGSRTLKVFSVIFLAMMSFPFFGSAMNGFSYCINRWCWALSLLEAYLIVYVWEDLFALAKDKYKKLIVCFGIYSCICMLADFSRTKAVLTALFFGLVVIIAIMPVMAADGSYLFDKRTKQLTILAVVCITVVSNYYFKVVSDGNYTTNAGMAQNVYGEKFLNNETSAVLKQSGSSDEMDYYRYSGEGLEYNAGLSAGLSSTVYYWSISNPYVVRFRELMDLNDYYIFRYFNLDGRTFLNALEAVKYYVVNESNPKIPYDHSYVETVDVATDVTNSYLSQMEKELGTTELNELQRLSVVYNTWDRRDVYVNDSALPIVYGYDKYMTEEDWLLYDTLARQELLLDNMVMSETPEGIAKSTEQTTSQTVVPYEMSLSEQAFTQDGHTIITTDKNQKVTLTLQGCEDSETYLLLKNFNFKATKKKDLYLGDDSVDPQNLYNKTNWKVIGHSARTQIEREALYFEEPAEIHMSIETSEGNSNSFTYCTPEFDHYTGRHDFALNLNYSKEPVTTITIKLPDIGVYSFDDMSVACQSMKGYTEKVDALRECGLTELHKSTDCFSGKISSDKNQMLCVAIPYSEGWSAYIDGKNTKLYHANIQYMGLLMPEGEHTFELRYKSPFLRLGFIVTLIAFICYGAFIIFNEKYQRKIKNERA